MAGTYLTELLAAYRMGNRRPRGTVIEALQWAQFQAHQRATMKRSPSVPAEGSSCRLGTVWTKADYIDTMNAVVQGKGIREIAVMLSRSQVAVKSRLRQLGLMSMGLHYQYYWRERVYKNCLNVALRGKEKGETIDLSGILNKAGWITTGAYILIPTWMVGKSAERQMETIKEDIGHNTPRDIKRKLDFKDLAGLKAAGYSVTSNNHRIISRIDCANWRERMAKSHAPWDAGGEGIVWASLKGSGDTYRRCYTTDKQTVPEKYWESVKKYLGNSGSGVDEYAPLGK